MKVFELTSGFLAAVVVALGANYYVKNHKVEEKPVVESAQATGTFLFQGGTDWTDPDAYQYSPSGTSCTTGSELCAIEAPIANPSAPDNQKEPVISGGLETELENLQDADPNEREASEQVMLRD